MARQEPKKINGAKTRPTRNPSIYQTFLGSFFNKRPPHTKNNNTAKDSIKIKPSPSVRAITIQDNIGREIEDIKKPTRNIFPFRGYFPATESLDSSSKFGSSTSDIILSTFFSSSDIIVLSRLNDSRAKTYAIKN